MDKEKLFTADGEPRFVRCFETRRQKVWDKYTVVFSRADLWDKTGLYKGRVCYMSMSGDPFHPQGFCQHGEARQGEFRARGSRIPFALLPPDCKKIVACEYREIWEI